MSDLDFGDADSIVHGALDYAELESLGLRPEEVIDFSVNANPYGPSPRVREAVASVAIDRYPDRACLELRRAILDYELSAMNLQLDALVCGNGTAELIWTIARACLGPGQKAAVIGPTFGEYRAASLAAGATVVTYHVWTADRAFGGTDGAVGTGLALSVPTEGFQPNTEEIGVWIRREKPALVWLCNPNNPTGTWLDREQIFLVAEACQNSGAILVVDEAYWRFVSPQTTFSAIDLIGTVSGLKIIVLRSLTKDYALAGLRLGYAVASVATVRLLQAQLPSWNVNSLAQAAGVAALADRAYLEETLNALFAERNEFFQALQECRLECVPSCTHFCLVHVKNAHDTRQWLLKRKILVRDCTAFGLPQYIRVSTRPKNEWQRLIVALQEGM